MKRDFDTWGIAWLLVATIGLIGLILGHYQHLLTFVVGLIMMAISCEKHDEDNE